MPWWGSYQKLMPPLAQKRGGKLFLPIIVSLRRRHQATLEAIFRRPTSENIRRDDVESLLLACGAHIEERAGSRVGVRLGASFRVLHRPHPGNNVDKGTVVSVREFLMRAGIAPEER